mmetsp:Transcript_94866/g.253681  ORF Transcript_94866/g.253681 Transcript_94866/m.253681 type:complete len:86 (-) Transcript_94866:117-374(-)
MVSQCHRSDSVFCSLHRWRGDLLSVVDEPWLSEELPLDDIILPEGVHVSLDDGDDVSVDELDIGPERWDDLSLAHLLEDDLDAGQ